jgi:hypothetical protein
MYKTLKNKKLSTFSALLLLLWCTGGCLRNELEELSFFTVETGAIKVQGTGRIRLSGRILQQGDATIEKCGFIFSNNVEDVQNIVNVREIPLSVPAPETPFETDFTALDPGKEYFFRAFAISGDRRQYGVVQYFALGEIVAPAFIKATVSNDTATVYARLSGVQTLQAAVEEHGFVYSFTNKQPDITASDCIVRNLGPANDDTLFSLKLFPLPFNTDLYVRGYAKSGNRVFYNKQAELVKIKGGWRRRSDFGQYYLGAATTLNGKGYVGFGMSKFAPAYFQSSIDNRMYQFDTTSGWRALPAFSFQKRADAALFGIGDTLYTLSGAYIPDGQGCPPYTLLDFRKFDTKTEQWSDIVQDPPFFRRLQAMSFTLQGKAYFGHGKYFKFDATLPPDCPYRDTFLSDFWQYSPENGRWRQVASLPYRLDSLSNQYGGRIETFFCTDGQVAYVGSGVQSTYRPISDFWRFVPPVHAVDTGRWEFIGYLPGEPRADAVAFCIGQKVYYGLGTSAQFRFLSDFWEYDPASNKWRKLQPFPGTPRSSAFAFALHGKGYMGTGNSREWTGVNVRFNILNDFWEYVPDK